MVPAEPSALAARGGEDAGWRRSVSLFRLFLREQSDPELFYRSVAEDAVCQVADYCDMRGRTVADVGGGAGRVHRGVPGQRGRLLPLRAGSAELHSRGDTAPAGAVIADGYWLPVGDGGADICFSSNVLEHVSDPLGLIEEMVRVTRPGGLIYLSFTNWYSPVGRP